MFAQVDAPGSETSHGYTRDDAARVFYWVYDHADDELSFREHGYPVDHPVHPSNEVVEHTENWIDESLDDDGRWSHL